MWRRNIRDWSKSTFPLLHLVSRECEGQMEKDVSQDVSDHKQLDAETC